MDHVTKRRFKDSATPSNFSFETMEVGQDHSHCLVKSKPRISSLALVRRLKQESIIQLWREHECELRRYFWKERTFWSDGYFCCTVASVSQEAEDFVVFSIRAIFHLVSQLLSLLCQVIICIVVPIHTSLENQFLLMLALSILNI